MIPLIAALIAAGLVVMSWACGKAYDWILHRAMKRASDDTSWAWDEGTYHWDDPGPDEMMPGCGHEVVDAAGTYDTGSGPAPGRGCER